MKGPITEPCTILALMSNSVEIMSPNFVQCCLFSRKFISQTFAEPFTDLPLHPHILCETNNGTDHTPIQPHSHFLPFCTADTPPIQQARHAWQSFEVISATPKFQEDKKIQRKTEPPILSCQTTTYRKNSFELMKLTNFTMKNFDEENKLPSCKEPPKSWKDSSILKT